jgi:hypothetical protein
MNQRLKVRISLWTTAQLSRNEQRLGLKALKPSFTADYKTRIDGDMAKLVRRVVCTPGTRPTVLGGVGTWANDPSLEASIYWLFGPAGTGKSTIAFTMARRFGLACDPGDRIALGATFFCSRHFPETRSVVWVIRTIVYQLALVCAAFAEAYHEHCDESVIHQGPAAQLEGLLVGPWKAAREANKDLNYLIDIDAVDELDNDGGSELIGALLKFQRDLEGLKFFITSREDQEIVAHAKSLGGTNVFRLHEISRKDADEDLRIYFADQLQARHNYQVATDDQIQRLVNDAAGLFIYGSTVVEYVGVNSRRPVEEQKTILDKLLDTSPSADPLNPRNATAALDRLYLQILREALNPEDPEKQLYQKRLAILHTFLCTIEPTSPAVVTQLLGGQPMANAAHPSQHESVADHVLRQLHAVLYNQGGQVMSFHKSFPDFIFDKGRSQEFYCDRASHDLRLAEGCFGIMLLELHFNMAEIQDSSIFDTDNATLQASVYHNIRPLLSYASQSWSQHLTSGRVLESTKVVQILHDFLQLPVMFWIETMNLLGLRARCEGMLRKAREWISSSEVRLSLPQ